MSKPKILSESVIAASRLFEIERIDLEFSNGEKRQYERVRSRAHGAVMVVPMLDDDTMLLVREYGGGIDEYVLGFPKGAIEKSESLQQTANRELMEEIGYSAKRYDSLGKYTASPNYMRSAMHILLARDLTPKTLVGDEPEPLEVVPWKLNNIDQLLEQPDFHEARSVAALFLALRKLHE